MVACQTAWTLFHTPTKDRARPRPEYLAHPALFSQAHCRSTLISPEQLVTDYILRLIEHPARCRCSILPVAGYAWRAFTTAGRWSVTSCAP